MQVKQRLDALTSLRFFAAAMIVIHHASGLFGLRKTDFFFLEQGVSFFFVLSGFILAYVYPKLETWAEIKHFWRARIARIYPAFFASFLLAFWLLSLGWGFKRGLANLFMLSAWIPLPRYFFSYNAPAWSISTEFFFYLAFPFLIRRWDKTWLIKLVTSGIIVLSLILVSNWLHLPFCTSINDGLTVDALVYIHPLSRIFEFIFGIFVAFYWRKKVAVIQWSELSASLCEIGVIFLVAASMHFAPLSEWVDDTWLGLPAARWSYSSGSMLAFGLLIYVIAIGRGRITVWLSHPLLVLLGEISFSLYLLHQILLIYYQSNIANLPQLSNTLSLAIFWVILLLASYLMWALIEMPGRRLLLGRGKNKIHGTEVMQASWHHHLNLNRNTLSAAAVLVGLLVSIYFSMGNIKRISPSDADAMTAKELTSVIGTRFSDLFALRGIKIEQKADGLHIDLAWESLIEQKLTYTNGIHLTDVNGNILIQADYKQPMNRLKVKQGTIWKDSIFIPKNKLTGEEKKLAIVLFKKGNNLLPVTQGERDWNNHRLLINLEK
ncbi:MAG: acyltransferase [Methylococcales bacterium]